MGPPRTLKKKGKALWNEVIKRGIKPEKLTILLNCCESQDRIAELTRILRQEGQIIADRWLKPKAHPAALLLKSELASFALLYKALGPAPKPVNGAGWKQVGASTWGVASHDIGVARDDSDQAGINE